MGSAVDPRNLTLELTRYQAAGLGGVHIIPIYGAKGYETNYIDYLSPAWMEKLAYTVAEARRLGLGVDMTTGSGWCFGGPQVTDREANAQLDVKVFLLAPGARYEGKLDTNSLQTLRAFSAEGEQVDLAERLAADGALDWSPTEGRWQIYALAQKPAGIKVKRAAPGGQGPMLNLFYPEAMKHYLERFDRAFAGSTGPKPRAMYHDSYEYKTEWAPGLLEAFARRRGYALETELPTLLNGTNVVAISPAYQNPDRMARVKSDYRETVSDLMVEESLPMWVNWSHRHDFLTRNQAHGSPGNWLDLYATADIPETEMFHDDRDRLISKFASSAAHVTGKPLVAAETGTWLKEHFTETLGDMKFLVDDLFLSGVNHVFYHGTCYSPDSAPWPGWLFYASYEMNPRNSVWHDADALNAYVTRCQSVLQTGRPDNDVLLYWPLHDFWHRADGMVFPMSVHVRGWFDQQALGRTARRLWAAGYAFDYASDRQLAAAQAAEGEIRTAGGRYAVVLVPPTEHLPLDTLRALLALADAGGTVIFEDHLPADVPGWGGLAARRHELRRLLAPLRFGPTPATNLQEIRYGAGRILLGDAAAALAAAGAAREPMFDQPGLMCLRRAFPEGSYYFVANRSTNNAVDSWVKLGRPARSVVVMDPMTGRAGTGQVRHRRSNAAEVRLSLAPGQSVLLRCFAQRSVHGPSWREWSPAGQPRPLAGSWEVRFLEGGPTLPAPARLERLASWTTLSDANVQRFAGTARYTLVFDRPSGGAQHWVLDLGDVAQSARVRLNGRSFGTLITPPFRVVLDHLSSRGNQLEVEVTNVSANRIRDLDRQGVKWKNFNDINFVNLAYQPFDASNWPITDSGLLGPVTLTPAWAR